MEQKKRRMFRNVNPEANKKRVEKHHARQNRIAQQKTEFTWIYWEGSDQNFWQATEDWHILTAFEYRDNPGVWYGLIDCSMIFDGEKARNQEAVLLTSDDPEEMKRIVIQCYVNNTRRGEK